MNIRLIFLLFIICIVASLAFFSSAEDGMVDDSAWMYDGQDNINSYTSKLPGDIFFDYTRVRDLFKTDSDLCQGITSTDLDSDGCSDIIIRMNYTEIIAVSGRDSHVIFHLDEDREISTSPLIMDINRDGHLEIIVGYRSGVLVWYILNDGIEKVREIQLDNQLNVDSQIIAMPSTDGTLDIIVTDGVGTIHSLSNDGAVNWEVEYSKQWPRSIIIDKFHDRYTIYSATMNDWVSQDHMGSDIVRIDGSSGQVEKIMYLDYDIYSDYFYTKPSIINLFGTKYIIIGGINGYLIDTDTLEIEQKISIGDALWECIPIPSENHPYVLLVGGGSIHLWDIINGMIKGENYLPFPLMENINPPIILGDMDEDTSLEIIIPSSHHIKILNLTNGEEITRITWDKNYTRGKIPKPLFADIDGDGFNELVYSCRLDTTYIQVFDSPNVEFSMNTSLTHYGATIYPGIPQRFGFRITNLQSIDRIAGGVLTVGKGDVFPSLELRGGSCTVVQGESFHLIDGLSVITSEHAIEYQFDLTIDWTIATEELQDTILSLRLDRRPVRNLTIPNVFRCENDLILDRQLQVYDPDGDPISEETWVHPTAVLRLVAGNVVFEGSDIAPAGHPYNVTMHTPDGPVLMEAVEDSAHTATVDLSGFADDHWTVTVTIEDVPYNGSGLTSQSFGCRIDRQPPELTLTNPEPGVWKVRQRLTVGVELYDNESGLDPVTFRFFVKLNDTTIYPVEIFDTSMLSPHHCRVSFVVDLQEGKNWFQLGAGDIVGNLNVSSLIPVNIDTTQIIFEDFTPSGWCNQSTVTVGITIVDLHGSGVNLSTVEYSYSVDGLFSYSGWMNAGLHGEAGTFTFSLRLVMEEGLDNYIRFRARDMAGTEPRMSDDNQVRIDTTSPWITIVEEEYNHLNTSVRFVLYDNLSGIDLDMLEVYITSNGTEIERFTTDVDDGNPGELVLAISCQFPGYVLNQINIEVLDRAGNWNSSTSIIHVNAPPVLQLVSPVSGSRHYTGSGIQFEAVISDPDGDSLEVVWSLPDGTILNTTSAFETQLEPGIYDITCSVTDGHEHVITGMVSIEVRNEPPPERFSFIIDDPSLLIILLVIIVILTIAYYYRQRFINNEE